MSTFWRKEKTGMKCPVCGESDGMFKQIVMPSGETKYVHRHCLDTFQAMSHKKKCRSGS